MHEYLFHRQSRCPSPDTPPEFLADDVFFHQWTTRQHPFAEIAEGDRLWWADKSTREIRWELRAVGVLKQQFNDPLEALTMLRQAYGLMPEELNDYFGSAPPSGWLLAFAVEVMQPVHGVMLPAGERLARNGLRSISAEFRATLTAAGLPAPAAEPIACPTGVVDATAISRVFVPTASRYVPASVKAEAWERSGGKCAECHCALERGQVHFDHLVPFSRGGTSAASNIQVMCAPCNLSKGAKMPARANVRIFDEPVADLAAVLGRHQPRNVEDLCAVLTAGVAAGELQVVRTALLSLYRDPAFDDAELNRCIDAVAATPELAELIAFLRLYDAEDRVDQLRSLLEAADEEVRLEAAVEYVQASDLDGDAALALLQPAIGASDRYISDLAVLIANDLPGVDQLSEEIPGIESLIDSPVLQWRCEACLFLAERLYDDAIAGESIDAQLLFRLLETALSSPDPDTAERAALLLAGLWSNLEDDDSKARATMYLDFAVNSDDAAIRSEVQQLRKDLRS